MRLNRNSVCCSRHCSARKIKFPFKPLSAFNKCTRCVEPRVRREGAKPFPGNDVVFDLTEQCKPRTWSTGRAGGEPSEQGRTRPVCRRRLLGNTVQLAGRAGISASGRPGFKASSATLKLLTSDELLVTLYSPVCH